MRERPEDEAHENREEDDRDAVVRNQGIEEVEHPHERIAEPAPHAELHHVLHAEVPEEGLLLRTEVEGIGAFCGHTGKRRLGDDALQHIVRLGQVARHRGAETRVRLAAGGKGGNEEAVLHRNPVLPTEVVDARTFGKARRALVSAATAGNRDEIALEGRIAVIAVVDDVRLAAAVVPGVDGEDVVLGRAHRNRTEREAVRGGGVRLREGLLDLDPIAVLQGQAACHDVVREHDEVRALLGDREVGIRLNAGKAFKREGGGGAEIEDKRRVLLRERSGILCVLQHLRGLHDRTARGERQRNLPVRQRLQLLRSFRFLRHGGRGRLGSRFLGGLDRRLRRHGGRRAQHLGVRGGILRSRFRRLLLAADRIPHPARRCEPQENRNQFFRLVHDVIPSFFQRPFGGTGS